METNAEKAEIGSWLSFHLYYHEDLERALHRLVVPLAHDLIVGRQAADRFFFVRYFLGGPHLRVRFRSLPGQGNLVKRVVGESTEEFLRACPSRQAIDPAEIAKANEGILLSDPLEQDDGVYPDNSLRAVVFRPEVERYGSEALLPHSLDFFCVSSLAVLDLLRSYEGRSRSESLYGAARLLFAQALGLAASPGHLTGLLRYAFDERWEPLKRKADSVYEKDPSAFLSLIRGVSVEIASSAAEPTGEIPGQESLHAAAKLLARDTRAGTPPVRGKILGSQMHMTANRMGLRMADEVYLGHLLGRALEAALVEEADLHADAIASAPRRPELRDCHSVAEIAARSLAAWLPRSPFAEEPATLR